MATIAGNLINFRVRPNGTADAFKTVICQEDVTFDIENEISERRTNCGIQTGIADPTFSASGNAVYDYTPLSTQVSWNDIKEYQKAKTKLDFQFYNAADVANGIAESEAVDVEGSGYFSQSSFTGSAEADGLGSFSWTFSGTGTLDEFDAS